MDVSISKLASIRRFVWPVITAAIAIAIVGLHYLYMPMPIDWYWSFYPAARELISLHSPYSVETFFSPPWTLIPLIPFALLPAKLSGAAHFVFSFAAVIYTAVKMGAKRLSLAAFLLSLPMIFLFFYGQIDWLIMIGLLLPPQFGLFLIFTKPQVGLCIALFWFIETYQKGGIREIIKVFGPFILIFCISLLIFGLWPLRSDLNLVNSVYSYSLYPIGIPVGITLLVAAVRKREIRLAVASSPFMAPYLGLHSWSTALLAILPYQWETLAFSAFTWIWFLVGLQRM